MSDIQPQLMTFDFTNIFFRNQDALYNPEKRMAINEGGTSSSKTYSILQLLIDRCQHRTKPILISVVSESFPHLRMGCVRDFRNLMGDIYDERKWNASNFFYTFRPGVIMEFFSADQPGKAAGPRRDILYCNEANNIPKVIFDQLDTRTRRFVFIDFNPVGEFWAHELKEKSWVEWIHSTYLDAKHVLPQSTVDKIEAKRETDPNWWNIYGLGRIGKIEGLVYPYFDTIDEIPTESGIEGYGLDFGFTDPAVLTYHKIIGDKLYSDEIFYETNLTNDKIAEKMEGAGLKKNNDEIWADAAEPKSIEEIYRYGFNIKACPKGPDSVEHGHQKVRQYKQFWTKRSLNCIKEQRNFRFIEDKNGKLTEKTTHLFSHGMDSRRYYVVGQESSAVPSCGYVE